MHDKARPQIAAVTQHQREQPHHAHHCGLIFEYHLEVREIDLRLLPGGGLKALLETQLLGWAHLTQKVRDQRIAAAIAERTNLAQQPLGAKPREGSHALAQVAAELLEQSSTLGPRPIGGSFQAACDVLANGLTIQAAALSDGRDRKTLTM